MTGYVADMLYWVAVVGDACDRRQGATRGMLVKALRSETSLSDAEAGEVVDAMVQAGKLVETHRLGAHAVYRCTMQP